MPEILEVETYRRAASVTVGRWIAAVTAPDAWYVKGAVPAAGLSAALVGRRITGVRRRGKLLLLDTSGDGGGAPGPIAPVEAVGSAESGGGPTLGLRFGMTGRLIVDGLAPIDQLLYAPALARPVYERFALDLAEGGADGLGGAGGAGALRLVDPRRLGGVELDPDEQALGPDALSLTRAELDTALAGAAGTLKGRLLDQARVAGIGNLLVDEILWRAGLAPGRVAGSLSSVERRTLLHSVTATLEQLGGRGGSHTGDLMAQRHPGGVCPRDGTPLRHERVAGRTTWWCPGHQA